MFNKNKISIIFIIIFLFIFFVLFIFVLQKNKFNKIEESSIIYNEDCYKDSIPVYGVDEIIYRKALLNQTIDDCFDLKASKIDNCISSIAVSSQNIKFCDKISDRKIREECPKFVILEKARINDDESFCGEINDASFKELCYNSIFKNNFNKERCFKLEGELKESCLDNYYYNYAYEKVDIVFCDNIGNNEIKEECREILSGLPVDTDSDGLVDFLEMNYGTDPFSFDTDGDGFSDGVEVENGYNPLKGDL